MIDTILSGSNIDKINESMDTSRVIVDNATAAESRSIRIQPEDQRKLSLRDVARQVPNVECDERVMVA